MKTTCRCPVCWRMVYPTVNGHIRGHLDTTDRATCPSSHEPFYITLKETQ